jgi:hypothetical protein
MGETTIKNTILEQEPLMRLVESGVMPSFIAHVTLHLLGLFYNACNMEYLADFWFHFLNYFADAAQHVMCKM